MTKTAQAASRAGKKAMPVLIGLHAEKGVGKDATADIPILHRGSVRIACADALREEVTTALQSGNVPIDAPKEIHELVKELSGRAPWYAFWRKHNRRVLRAHDSMKRELLHGEAAQPMVAYKVTVAQRPDEIDNGHEIVDLQVEAPDKEKPIRHVRMPIDVTAEKLEVNPKIQEVPKENA